MKHISKLLLIVIVLIIFFVIYKVLGRPTNEIISTSPRLLWKIQSVDTMKYSRDLAREKLGDKEFSNVIDQQVKAIAATGATHVAIGTPYEEEFIPILTQWVSAARANNLHVWFRGNLAGWEGWFNYPKITKDEHTRKVVEFVTRHQDLFEDGDIFTSCPECENGGPGDPRATNDLVGFKNFLISEHKEVEGAFTKSSKDVLVGLYSMNGDVAKLTMDPETTKALGGYVAVDHYVKTPEKLADDVKALAESSGGKVVLGEWGAPIPDINGKMTDKEQEDWISAALFDLSQVKELVGLNYWTSLGSSTAIWSNSVEAKPAVAVLSGYYSPKVINGVVSNEIDNLLDGVEVRSALGSTKTDTRGRYQLTVIPSDQSITFSHDGYTSQTLDIDQVSDRVVLTKKSENVLFSSLSPSNISRSSLD